jgi:hypothetical protein
MSALTLGYIAVTLFFNRKNEAQIKKNNMDESLISV